MWRVGIPPGLPGLTARALPPLFAHTLTRTRAWRCLHPAWPHPQELPPDWRCPVCGAEQKLFVSRAKKVSGFAQNQGASPQCRRTHILLVSPHIHGLVSLLTGYGYGANSLTSEQKSLLIYGPPPAVTRRASTRPLTPAHAQARWRSSSRCSSAATSWTEAPRVLVGLDSRSRRRSQQSCP